MSESEVQYKTTAINTGGRNGESKLPDGSFSVKVSPPKEMGGSGQGSNPEQLFALGYSACFNSAVDHFKREEKVTGESQVTTTVFLKSDPENGGYKLAVELSVAIEGLEEAQVQKLADKAHDFCPYSRAIKGNVDATVKAVEFSK